MHFPPVPFRCIALRWALVAAIGSSLFGMAFGATGVVEINGGPGPAKKERKPSPPLSSLAAPRASGPLHILLVDDDWSGNNADVKSKELSRSDRIFRELVTAAVGGDSSRWSVEIAPNYDKGPAFERLRDFNVVIWYNGSSYGGNPDHGSVLSVEDEKVVRRYLEETGGAFILISPGFVNSYSYGNTWDDAPVPFLTEVAGVNGFRGLAKRFEGGQVSAADGAPFAVERKGAIETIFSALNPDGAAVVFKSDVDQKPDAAAAGTGVAVAVTNPYGAGRFTYVAFSFENIADTERTRAFTTLLSSAGTAPPTAVANKPATTNQPAPAGTDATAVTSSKPTAAEPVSAKPSAPTALATGTMVESRVAMPPRELSIRPEPTLVATTAASSTATTSQTLTPTKLEQINTMSSQSIKAPEAGPAVRSVKATPKTVGVQMIEWIGELNTSYDVFRQNGAGWQMLAEGVDRSWWYEDHAMVAGGTNYRVVAHYPDNRVGSADATLTNPILPTPPTRLSVSQSAAGTLHLAFFSTNDPGLQGYQVYVSSAPNAGQFVAANSASTNLGATFSGLAVGPAVFRVIPQYDGKLASLETTASGTVAVWNARYRIILLGFRAVTATPDEDIFGGDGAGDELFFGAYRVLVSRDGNQVDSQGIVRSLVYGDNGRFPARVRAGTASPTGGIRDGDVIPSDALVVAQPRVAAQADRLPMLLWEGTLTAGGSRLGLGLVAFEWDNTSEVSWNAWRDWWTSPTGTPLVIAPVARLTGYRETDMAPSVLFGPKDALIYPTPPALTRPINLTDSFDAKYAARLQHYPQGLVISQENIEAKLGTRSAVTMGLTWLSNVRPAPNGQNLNSEYVIYLQLERMDQ